MFLQILKNSIHPLQVGLPKTKLKIFLMKHSQIQIFFPTLLVFISPR